MTSYIYRLLSGQGICYLYNVQTYPLVMSLVGMANSNHLFNLCLNRHDGDLLIPTMK